jgi:hypothetical protein
MNEGHSAWIMSFSCPSIDILIFLGFIVKSLDKSVITVYSLENVT